MFMQGEAHLQAERTSGTSTHQHGQKNTEHEEPEDIPWETSFFNDMQLDEVKNKKQRGCTSYIYLNLTEQMLS
jgi:hypothetical protein